MKRPLSRRTFLRGAGGVVIALPFLDAMTAFGQSSPTPAKRFLSVFSPNGTVASSWFPSGTETAFDLAPTLLAPLNELKSKLVILKGIDYKSSEPGLGDTDTGSPKGDGHTRVCGAVLTGQTIQKGDLYGGGGWANGISIDQHLAQQIGKEPFRSLVVGGNVVGATAWTRTSFSAAARPVEPMHWPVAVWDALFAKGIPGDTSNPPPSKSEPPLERRISVLDAVREDIASLKAKLGAADNIKLEEHLDSVQAMESRLKALAGNSSTPSPATSSCIKPSRPEDVRDYPNLLKLHSDLIVYALRCDLTRVVSFMTGQCASHEKFKFLNINRDFHDEIAHPSGISGTQANTYLRNIGAWYAEQLAYLLKAMNAVQEGDKTLLDNSLVWYMMEHSVPNAHSVTSVPMLLAGSCGGQLKTGRFLQMNGVSHNNLLVSLLNLMGVPATTFGDARFCTGPLNALSV